MDDAGERSVHTRNVGVLLLVKDQRVKKFREDAEKEKQEGIQGQWQRESPAKEYLEQVKCCNDTDCTPRMMKQAFLALKGGDRGRSTKTSSESKRKPRNGPLTEIQEAFEKVAKDEARKLSTVQEIMHGRKHRLTCGALLRQQEGKEALRCHTCARIATVSPMEDYVWWVSGEKKHTKLVVCGLWRKI